MELFLLILTPYLDYLILYRDLLALHGEKGAGLVAYMLSFLNIIFTSGIL